MRFREPSGIFIEGKIVTVVLVGREPVEHQTKHPTLFKQQGRRKRSIIER
jgi:hypothetical protein